ncbi:hypothetical protein Gpo141_00000701 [Globisporangium polare]
MVTQYLERKKEYPDCMLLFQVGDFYEFFGDDARRASHLLNLALTKKAKQANELEEMCGFPLTSLDSYVEKLVMHHGVKVAICNQVESVSSARKRGYKSLVNRQVVRIVTPGSLVEDTMLTPDENNYLAALYFDQKGSKWGLAWADLSTGEFVSTTSSSEKLASALLRCSPKEILLPAGANSNSSSTEMSSDSLPEDVKELLDAVVPHNCMRTYRPHESYAAVKDRVSLSRATSHAMETEIASMDRAEQAAACAILDYVDFTQKSATSLVRAPLHVESSDHMIIDASAWKALELSKSLSGSKGASLLHSIDSTITPGGSRLLASQLSSPLMNLAHLERRLDAVTHFFTQESLLRQTRKQLAEVFDMERSLQRLSIGVATPKDLKNVASTIDEAKKLVDLLEAHDSAVRKRYGSNGFFDGSSLLPGLLQECCGSLCSASDQREVIERTAAEIHAALKDEFTSLNSKSDFVKPGYSAELDHWRGILHHNPTHSAQKKQELQQKYRQLLSSTRLRVVYQAEKGYFIDIPHEENTKLLQLRNAENNGHHQALGGGDFVMIQSLKNTARYRTEELRELNRELIEAAQEVARIESEIFDTLRAQVLSVLPDLQTMALAIAQVDVVCSHAQVALDRNFTRPLLDASRELHIEDGRHAVVEAAHLKGRNSRAAMRAFIPNSLHFAPQQPHAGGSCWLLTGPNMGGKSTFLRQNAHLVVLAQMGSFVPAKFARIGLVDKLFCRVGSADDLASDKSTFMVEMQETSTILTQATPRSFVLMDEVGRGTSVNDGIAIAGAVLEALCAKQVRTLFATHFTVLSELIADEFQQEMQLYRMEVLERQSTNGKQLVFSHRVVQGLAQQSYGINTAALAGCPASVVARATELLDEISVRRDGNDPLHRRS